jgi:hypothetical protein
MENLLKIPKFALKVLRKVSHHLKNSLSHLLFLYFLIKRQAAQVPLQLKLQPKFL